MTNENIEVGKIYKYKTQRLVEKVKAKLNEYGFITKSYQDDYYYFLEIVEKRGNTDESS